MNCRSLILGWTIAMLTLAGCGGSGDACTPDCSVGYTCVEFTCVANGALPANGTEMNGQGEEGTSANEQVGNQAILDENGKIICPGPQEDGPDILVHGSCASLTLAAVHSYLDSYEHVYPYLTDEPLIPNFREENIKAFKDFWFSQMKDPYQAVLSVWDQEVGPYILQNFASLSEGEQVQLVLLILVVAYGEEAIQPLIDEINSRNNGGSGGGNGGGTISIPVNEESYNDTQNAASCWASAGCDSYDSDSNTFSYSDGGYASDY